jgi:hypothetical protein
MHCETWLQAGRLLISKILQKGYIQCPRFHPESSKRLQDLADIYENATSPFGQESI